MVYAALSTQLTIAGNAGVVGSTWDVHLENPIVTNGSVSDTLPVIVDPTKATFNVNFNLPGDFYEFTIDVVNDGTVDAMIDSVVKAPELTTEQAKYFNYDVTYQSGESITTKQLVNSGSFVRLKVRLEYKENLTASDLPISTTSLSLGFTLVYSQADGSGIDVNDKVIKEINFYIDNSSYVIYEDMTWEEWLETPDGNASGVYHNISYGLCSFYDGMIVGPEGAISSSDYILNYDYYTAEYLPC